MKTLLLLLCLLPASCRMPKEVVIHSKDGRLIKDALLDEMGRFQRRLTLERETATQLVLSQPTAPRIAPKDVGWVLSRGSNFVQEGGRSAGWSWHTLLQSENSVSFESIAIGNVFAEWQSSGASASNWVWFTLHPAPDGTLVRTHHEMRVFFVPSPGPAPMNLPGGRLPKESYEPITEVDRVFDSVKTIRCEGGINIFAVPISSNEMPIVLRDAKAWLESRRQPPHAGSRTNLLRP